MFSILTARRVSRIRFAEVALSLALLSVAGCDKVPLLAPALSTITLSANTSIVQTNGVAEIRATVLESSGTPVQNGTTVTFSTNLGTLSPPESRTHNGVASVQFVANGQSGIADIRAASGAAATGSTANPSLRLTVGGAATGRVLVAASPSSVPAAGGSTTITATVLDTNGNPLTGVAVGFSSTTGTLSSSIATSNGNGAAQVTLTTNRDAVVTATAGVAGTATAITGTVNVTVNALPTLSVTPPATAIEDTAAVFTVAVGAATQDTFQSVTIDFGDGTLRNLGPITTGTTSVSNVYRNAGTFTVTVTGVGTSGGTQRATAVVTVSPHAPVNVTIVTTPTSGSTTATTIAFAATAAPSTGVSSYNWDFGDGVVANGIGSQTSHRYNLPGTYAVTVTAVMTDGNTATGRTEVLVQ